MPIRAVKGVYAHIRDIKANMYRVVEESVPAVWSHNDLGATVSYDIKITALCLDPGAKGFRIDIYQARYKYLDDIIHNISEVHT